MKLTAEQIEELRGDGPNGITDGSWQALCDMALSSLRVQEGVMVREPTDKMVWAGMTQSEQAAAVNGDLSGVSRVIRQWQKMLAAAPSAQNAETQGSVATQGAVEKNSDPAVSAPSAEEKFTLAHNVLNRVDMLLSEAGFKQDASVRHQLSIAKSIFREAEASLKPKEGGAG